MKKIIVFCLICLLSLSLLAGCKTPNSTATKYQDGIYFAQEKGFNEKTGWKSTVTIEVKDGKIISAIWNAANKNGGQDKKTLSKNGGYPMVAAGGAQAPWHEQAEKAENHLVKTQNTTVEYKDDEGHTDAISGVSIHVIEFFTLAEEALANGPVGSGKYKDGTYHAEESEFVKGWKYTVDLTVINGNIVAVNWNGINVEGGDDKKTASVNGNYPMVEAGGAQAPWHEQANSVENHLLKTQDTTVEYKDDEGHTDAISGVSIHVIEFFTLVQEALKDAQ